jgi:hypothetical protein
MPSSSWALQQAIHAALVADAALLALLGGPRIFDDVPQGQRVPYVTLGQTTVADWSTDLAPAEQHTLTLHVWSRAGGRRETHEIMGALKAALHDRDLALADHRLVYLRHELSEARRDPDADLLHGIVRLRALTEPL